MSKIKILGSDPAFANYGMAIVEVDIFTKEMNPLMIRTVKTAKTKDRKKVRVSSDNVSRARTLYSGFREWEGKVELNAAEIPYGGQSASAAFAFGVVTGIIACHDKPLIQVSPAEVKKVATGYSTASKQEMIEWATELWPDLPWKKGTAKSGKKYSDLNEHMADALAIVAAAIQTDQFDQATAMMKAMTS